MPTTSIQIVNCGSQSPIGTWTSMSAANVRAGLARISAYPHYEDTQWSQVSVAMAEYLDPAIPNLSRFLKLGLEALKETLSPLKQRENRVDTIPLLIGLPEKREGLSVELESKLVKELGAITNDYGTVFRIEFFRGGHAAGMEALRGAIRKLENGETEFCIAGGIESYLDELSLNWLEQQGLLKCSDNKWGMTPGEAAGFCLLTLPQTAQKQGLHSYGELLGVSVAEEETGNGDVCLGRGLTQAIKEVVSTLPKDETIQQVYCDLNGQRHRADEYGYAFQKVHRYLDDPKGVIAPANQWGDLGAASVPLLIGLITESGRKGYAKGPNNLVFAMSPGGKRGAALIKLNQEKQQS